MKHRPKKKRKAKASVKPAVKPAVPMPSHHAELMALRSEIDKRQVYADAIIDKLGFGGYAAKQSLMRFMRAAQKVTGFDLPTLKKYGLLKPEDIEARYKLTETLLRVRNRPLFDSLVAMPSEELRRAYRLLGDANLQRRYGTKIQDKEIGVEIALPEDSERPIELGKREVSVWKQSKRKRAEVQQAFSPLREKLKAQARRKHRPVRETVQAYVAGIKAFGEYVDQGLKQRRKWMNTVEKRANTRQNMSNIG